MTRPVSMGSYWSSISPLSYEDLLFTRTDSIAACLPVAPKTSVNATTIPVSSDPLTCMIQYVLILGGCSALTLEKIYSSHLLESSYMMEKMPSGSALILYLNFIVLHVYRFDYVGLE